MLNEPWVLHPGEAKSEGEKLLTVSDAALHLQAMKQAEDGSKDIIVRLTEIYGSRGTASVTPGFGFCKAYLCNMLEEQETELAVNNGVVMLPYQTHEIVTVRFVR